MKKGQYELDRGQSRDGVTVSQDDESAYIHLPRGDAAIVAREVEGRMGIYLVTQKPRRIQGTKSEMILEVINDLIANDDTWLRATIEYYNRVHLGAAEDEEDDDD